MRNSLSYDLLTTYRLPTLARLGLLETFDLCSQFVTNNTYYNL